MRKPKIPLTFSESARTLADASQLRYLAARELLEELSGEVQTFAQEYTNRDTSDAIEALTEGAATLSSLSDLGVGLDSAQAGHLTACVEELAELVPSSEDFETLVTAIEELEQGLDRLGEMRDTPSYYEASDKAEARDEVRSQLHAVADALEALESGTPLPSGPPRETQRLIEAAGVVAQRPGPHATTRALYCHAVIAVLTYQLRGGDVEGVLAEIVAAMATPPGPPQNG